MGLTTQIAKFMGPTWGQSGSCWPQMGLMLAPWTLLSGKEQTQIDFPPKWWWSSLMHHYVTRGTVLILKQTLLTWHLDEWHLLLKAYPCSLCEGQTLGPWPFSSFWHFTPTLPLFLRHPVFFLSTSWLQHGNEGFNSLLPGRCGCDFKCLLVYKTFNDWCVWIFFEIALLWMSADLLCNKSTLVEVMAWYCHTPSHYLNLCWPSSMTCMVCSKSKRVNIATVFDVVLYWTYAKNSFVKRKIVTLQTYLRGENDKFQENTQPGIY